MKPYQKHLQCIGDVQCAGWIHVFFRDGTLAVFPGVVSTVLSHRNRAVVVLTIVAPRAKCIDVFLFTPRVLQDNMQSTGKRLIRQTMTPVVGVPGGGMLISSSERQRKLDLDDDVRSRHFSNHSRVQESPFLINHLEANLVSEHFRRFTVQGHSAVSSSIQGFPGGRAGGS